MSHTRKPSVDRRTARTSLRNSITFPADLYATVMDMAVKEKRSFSEQVVLLVEWGLESIDREITSEQE